MQGLFVSIGSTTLDTVYTCAAKTNGQQALLNTHMRMCSALVHALHAATRQHLSNTGLLMAFSNTGVMIAFRLYRPILGVERQCTCPQSAISTGGN